MRADLEIHGERGKRLVSSNSRVGNKFSSVLGRGFAEMGFLLFPRDILHDINDIDEIRSSND